MKKMFEYIKSGIEMVLVTVVASSGATPRGAGAKMIVTEEGRIWGTIGGGAVEYRASLMAKQVLEEKKARIQDTWLLTVDGADQVVFYRREI